MISIDIDEQVLKKLIEKELKERMDKLERQQTFWDSEDLKKHCRMSWNTIQDTFFHEPDFPKAKVGGKWLYPAKEAEAFLLDWLERRKL